MIEKLDGQDITAATQQPLGEPERIRTLDKAAHLEAIMDAGRRIHEAIDTLDVIISARLGVHRSDLRCLHMLEAGPATAGEVAAHTGLTSGSVTALLDRLEALGYVERRRSDADRRSIEIAILEPSITELNAVDAEIKQGIRDFFIDKPVAEVAETGRALGQFADALGGFAERLCKKS